MNSAMPGRIGRRGLNSNQLRLIAVITMVIDHSGQLLLRYGVGTWLNKLHTSLDIYMVWYFSYYLMRTIGRIAFPMFVVLLISGYLHTRNWKKYALRLALLAVISEVPFDFVSTGKASIYWKHQNTVFILLLGLLMLKIMDEIMLRAMKKISHDAEEKPDSVSVLLYPQLATIMQIFVVAAACLISWGLRFDYDYGGILLIALLYWFRADWKTACFWGWILMSFDSRSIHGMIGYAIAFLLLYWFNGEKGKMRVPQWLTYGVYPLHLVILWICYVGLCGFLARIPV